MLQQQVTNLSENLKKWRNQKINPPTKSWKQLSAWLVRQVLISQMPALIVYVVLAQLMTRDSTLHNISSSHYILQKKEKIEKWSESSPWLNKRHIRLTDQSEQICKESFQCWFCICWHQLPTQNPLFK